MICEICNSYNGDKNDYLIKFITGHHPECNNFKIEKEKFIDEFNAQVMLLHGRALSDIIKNEIMNPHKKEQSSSGLIKKLFTRLMGNYYPIASNCYIFAWESDLIAISKEKRYVTEYEIKVSRQDFKADFKKIEKHDLLIKSVEDKKESDLIPNYFYYVTTPGLIDKSELPPYAGLIEVGNSVTFIKKAPLLHKKVADDGFEIQLLKKIYYKYWGKFDD